tara:strand:- start:335 stop:745 length:411 start_codon:yes stop_codon:yes gene_type:complete
MVSKAMMTLKKVWVWIKKHWYVPVLFVLVLVGTVFSLLGMSHNKKLIKMLDINKKSYEDQIKAIEKSHEEEMKRKEELYSKYVETMKNLHKDHDVSLDNLDKEKKKQLDSMVKKYKGSPEDLAKDLSEMFGVDYDG